jgi:hypothetical protein
MRNISDKSFREIQNTHYIFNKFFSKILPFMNKAEKYCRVGQAIHDNMAHTHCMLDTKGYKHTLRMCNNYCFSPPSMIARTLLDVMLYTYVHCLFVFSFGAIRPTQTSVDTFFRLLDRTRTHTQTHTHTGRTRDEWSARNRRRYLHNKHMRRTSMSPAGLKLATPAIQKQETCVQ